MARKKKGPSVKDYGGHCYTSGRRQRIKIGEDSTLSMRCNDCHTLRYVTPKENTRAARPKCLKCGGLLNACDSQLKRTKAERVLVYRPDGQRCKACGLLCTTPVLLRNHLSGRSDCRDEYQAERYTRCIFGLDILVGTVYIVKDRGTKSWHVRGVNPSGVDEVLQKFYTKTDAFESLSEIEIEFEW